MNASQHGILAPIPPLSRYLEFVARPDMEVTHVLRDLRSQSIDQSIVVGLSSGLVQGMGRSIEGLRPFPSLRGPGCVVPSTQADLWCWVRGDDRGRITHAARALVRLLRPAFRCDRVVDGFKYDRGLDLTGYEDGTENPEGDDAVAAAIVLGAGQALDGSSFVAVQQWVHDLDHFEGLTQDERDNIIGRRMSDNEELDDAPDSAHVKRTAQESFDPQAFVVRRSMPRGGRQWRRFDVCRLRQIVGCLRGATAPHDRARGWLHRRALPVYAPDLRQLFLVPPACRRKSGSQRPGALTGAIDGCGLESRHPSVVESSRPLAPGGSLMSPRPGPRKSP